MPYNFLVQTFNTKFHLNSVGSFRQTINPYKMEMMLGEVSGVKHYAFILCTLFKEPIKYK
jgi:hypothetical protein